MLKELLTETCGSQLLPLSFHYARLMELKPTATWKNTVAFIKRPGIRKPFLKKCFDTLEDKYDYERYCQIVRQDKDFRTISSLLWYQTEQKEREEVQEITDLYLITESYIGFLVEELIGQEAREQGYRVYQNKVLDLEYKTDLLFNGYHFQVKNISFLETSQIENKLKTYIEANKRLFFVFYELQDDDVKLVRIGGKAFLKAQEIDDFTQILPTENISIKEFVNSTTRK